MDFSFTEEQELFRKSVRVFFEDKLAVRADEIDERGEIPRDLLEEMGVFGLPGITISREFGVWTVAFDIIKDVMLWHEAFGYTKEAGPERGLRGVASYIV